MSGPEDQFDPLDEALLANDRLKVQNKRLQDDNISLRAALRSALGWLEAATVGDEGTDWDDVFQARDILRRAKL